MGEIRYEVSNQIAHITIANQAKFNAISLTMWQQLISAFEKIAQNRSLRAVTLQGEGDKAFSSGADISEFENVRDSKQQVAEYDQIASRGLHLVRTCRLPVIAFVRGICMGGGMALASMADVRYCTKTARFRMPAARIGVGYDYEGTRRLVELIGSANTSALFFFAESFDGAEAERIGLVNKATEDSHFEADMEKKLSTLLQNAPLPMIAAKYAMNEMQKNPDQRDMERVEALIQGCFDSEDYKEGRTAFMEKRKAFFTGK